MILRITHECCTYLLGVRKTKMTTPMEAMILRISHECYTCFIYLLGVRKAKMITPMEAMMSPGMAKLRP